MNAEETLIRAALAAIRGDWKAAEAGFASREPEAVVDWAIDHRLAALLHAHMPADSIWCERLRPARLQELACHLYRQTCIAKLLAAGRERGIRFCAFKGLGIALVPTVYPAPALRPLGDLDLLVAPTDLDAAMDAARSIGFATLYPDPVVLAFEATEKNAVSLVHPQHGLLELHHYIRDDIPPDVTARMLQRAVDIEAFGGRLGLLCPPDLLLALTVHAVTSDPGHPWVWLIELGLLAETMTLGEWELFERETGASGNALYAIVVLETMARSLDWRVGPPGLPERLRRLLTARERRALHRMGVVWPPTAPHRDSLMLARRLSGRPMHGRKSLWRTLWRHPGAICSEYRVRSGTVAFWRCRATDLARRVWRGARTATRKPET